MRTTTIVRFDKLEFDSKQDDESARVNKRVESDRSDSNRAIESPWRQGRLVRQKKNTKFRQKN
jgi:hypothetical protein